MSHSLAVNAPGRTLGLFLRSTLICEESYRSTTTRSSITALVVWSGKVYRLNFLFLATPPVSRTKPFKPNPILTKTMKFLKSSTKAKLEEERRQRAKLEADLVAARHKEAEREAFDRSEAERQGRRMIHEQIERDKHNRELEEALKREEQWRSQVETRRRMEKEAEERDEHYRRQRFNNVRNASPETLRSLRELIRERYQLDVEIWNLRGVRKPDQPLVTVKMQKADDLLEEIMTKVSVWTDNASGHWTDEEWDKVKEIQARLRSPGKRIWAANPPWADKTLVIR
jgi:hypothetical protein